MAIESISGISSGMISAFFRVDHACFAGYVVDKNDMSRQFVVQIFIDSLPIGVMTAEIFSDELFELDVGDACFGFSFDLQPSLVENANLIEARLANLGNLVGAPLQLDTALAPTSRAGRFGEARWVGGLKITGWTPDVGAAAPKVRAFIDDEMVAESHANRWRHIDEPRSAAMRAYELDLPSRFADGQVWRVTIKLEDGRELAGSPVTLCAFDGGLEQTLKSLGSTPGQALQGEMFDRLVPQSLPFSLYGRQRSMFQPPQSPSRDVTIAVVFLDGDGLQVSTDSLATQSHSNWICGVIPTTNDRFSFETGEMHDFVADHATGADWFVFAMPGVVFAPNALARLSDGFDRNPALIYADLEIEAADGGLWPVAFPAFDYERMLEQSYFSAFFALPRRAVVEAIEKGATNLFRIANSVVDQATSSARVIHLPGPIARFPIALFENASETLMRATTEHLCARGIQAELRAGSGATWPICRVFRRFAETPAVSILIPTRNRVDLLSKCLDSISAAVTRTKAEIIIIDNESNDAATLDYFRKAGADGIRIVSLPGSFNFSRLNNVAAQEANGDFLCFLNNDVVAQDEFWLEEMLSRHADPNVGAVGAALLYPSGVVQHGGVTLGVNFRPIHAFNDRIANDPGYTDLLKVAHGCSAVTAACMTTPRTRFLAEGGFDEILFPVNFNDVDYCLRLANAGLNTVLTPHARLVHRESVSRGRDDKPDSSARFGRELRNLRNKWGEALMADPYYNPLLALIDPPYSALAWPPRSFAPRSNALPGSLSPAAGI